MHWYSICLRQNRFFNSSNMSVILFSLWCSSILAITHAKYVYETEYLEVPVDQFSFTNNQTFKLRYLLNDSYFEPKTGPIFFYAGNEGDIRMFSQNSGFMWEAAKQFRALIVFAEHRYYGMSLPFGNKSLTEPKYFGYLTSQQALADYVDVIDHIKHKRKLSNQKSNPVIVFGGSYGGMMAAWMRMKYPAVVEGCFASSAPIWHFTGMLSSCSSFYEKVTEVFNLYGSKCTDNIRKSWSVIDKMAAGKNGRKWISKNWKLCKPIATKFDGYELRNMLSNIYVSAAMVNYPYANDFLKPVPGNPVSEMCKPINKRIHSKTKLLRALFQAISVYMNHTGTSKCFDWEGNQYGDVNIAGWYIQTCTEMVMPFCSNGKKDMFFPGSWNFEDHAKNCFKIYGVRPQERLVEKLYGGKSIEAASNIIFSNGELDPWMVGGVTKSISKTVIAVMLQGAAHHLDLRESHPKDPKSVVNAKKLYIRIFETWIREYHNRHQLQ